MEHFVLLFVGLIRNVNERSLHGLGHWIGDLQELRNAPAEALHRCEIEIGPWKRSGTRYIVLPLLSVLLLQLVVMLAILVQMRDAASIAIVVLISAVGLSIAYLVYSMRGGHCVLQSNGVEFRFRGFTVFCPWELFDAAGQPIYDPGRQHLFLPVAATGISGIELRKDDTVIAHGADACAPHFRFLPSIEIRLKVVYGVRPDELGLLLLDVGRKLAAGRPARAAAAHADSGAAAGQELGDWMRVSLTRLLFPALCCDCVQPTDSWQEFVQRSFAGEDLRLMVPVCKACQRANRRRYWHAFLMNNLYIVIGVTVFGLLVGALLDIVGLTPEPGAMTVVLAFVGIIFSPAFSWMFARDRARKVAAPIRFAGYRVGERTIQLRFRNLQYRCVFLAAIEGQWAWRRRVMPPLPLCRRHADRRWEV